jgi:hypothetical protein
MKPEYILSVADDFTKYPGFRYKQLGKGSGEEFFTNHLTPAFTDYVKVVIKLDGTSGYGSSFLEEAFGSLVRDLKLSPKDLRQRLVLISTDTSKIIEIWQYIEDAVNMPAKVNTPSKQP